MSNKLLQIARHEGLALARDGRFRWACAVVFVLLGLSLALGAQQYRERERERAVAAEISRQQWEAQPSRNPHGAAHFGIYVLRPFQPTSLLEPGLQRFLGEAAFLEAHRQNPTRYRPVEDATAVARMAELTTAAILQHFLPLLIFLFAFTAFASERERGTLRMLASSGVAPSTLAIGKALGVAAALALLLIPAILLGSAVLGLAAAGSAGLGRFLGMLTGFLVFYGGLIGLALAISAWSRSSRVALLAVLGFWVANGFLVPVLVSDLAERLYPVMSTQDFLDQLDADLAKGFDGHNLQSPEALELTQRTLEEYGVNTVEALPINIAGVAFLESEQQSQTIVDRHFGELAEIYQRQDRLTRIAALVAPFLAVRSWSMGLAGTDIFHHLHFVAASEDYRRDFNRRLNEDLRDGGPSGQSYSAPEEFWAELPQFNYSPPITRQVLSQNQWHFAVLSLWSICAITAAIVAAHRLT
ncbi:MAG: DUF3526 domain-containing protein, partial [Acidobacteriota bacterium]